MMMMIVIIMNHLVDVKKLLIVAILNKLSLSFLKYNKKYCKIKINWIYIILHIITKSMFKKGDKKEVMLFFSTTLLLS